jgi:hypothetical protein
MDNTEKKRAAPPYVAYKTLKNFLEKFTQGVPGRIDRGLMSSMSGAAQSQVTTAMRYLGFISDAGIPTDVMKIYVAGQEEKRKETLRDVLAKSYPFVFGEEAEFDFSLATGQQLREEFEAKTSATGETVARCIGFLKDAAEDAGIVLSPYITQKKARSASPKKRVVAPRKDERKDSDRGKGKDHPAPPPASEVSPIPAQASMLLWGLFQRMPTPGTPWAHDDRKRWLDTFNNVLALEYPE